MNRKQSRGKGSPSSRPALAPAKVAWTGTIWAKAEKLAALASIPMSVVAILLSLRGYQSSQQALSLSVKEFEASRQLVLRGTLSETSPGAGKLHLTPVDPQVLLQRSSIEFPTEVFDTPWVVDAPDFDLPLEMLTYRLEALIAPRIPRPQKQNTFVIPTVTIPVLIQASYVAKNEPHWQSGMYGIEFELVISDRVGAPPQISYKGLTFYGPMPADDSARQLLHSIFSSEFETLAAQAQGRTAK